MPYLLQLLEPVRSGALKSVAPTDAATDRYNDMLQARLEDSAWSVCASWYRVGGRGRIFGTFPGPLVLLWWWLRKPRWEDYEVEGAGAEEWRRGHAQRSPKALLATAALVGALGILASAVFRNGVNVGEMVKQAVRVLVSSLSHRICRRSLLKPCLVQAHAIRFIWNRSLGLLPT